MNEKGPERTWSAPPSFMNPDEPSTSDANASRSSTPASCDDALFNFPSEKEQVVKVALSILGEKQAIPIRVKILLDKALSLLTEEEIVEVLRASSWSWLDYCRGYKLEDPQGIPVFDWHMVDEITTMDRFTSFQLCTPLLQSFRAGFFTPWAPLMPPMSRNINAILPLPYRTETRSEATISIIEESVNVTDSPSPSPAETVPDDSSPIVSSDSPTEDSPDAMKLKKRVTCDVCSKSFCDKGALKIHTSAVHLKEMHKCTVPGCDKEFSSRRSRNRHSSNSNPKLHMPEGSQSSSFREQVALSMSMIHNGLTGGPLVTSPLPLTCTSDSPTSTSPNSPTLSLSRKRKAPDSREDLKELSWRKAVAPFPPKMPYSLPADAQMLLALQLFQVQTNAVANAAVLSGFLNNSS